jgi:SAM-dependent methyltransferase
MSFPVVTRPTVAREYDTRQTSAVRAEEWNERYDAQRQWSEGPNALVAELLADVPPGSAVDLAAGEGRHALWLASLGWEVTAVDFSSVGIGRGQGQRGADRVRWVTADVLDWTAPSSSLDLVLVAYLHLPTEEMTPLLLRSVDWLRPGGRFLLVGHDLDNLTRGVGGPQEPGILHSLERLAPVAALLDVDRFEQVPRQTPDGTAVDTLLWGRRRPEPGTPSA